MYVYFHSFCFAVPTPPDFTRVSVVPHTAIARRSWIGRRRLASMSIRSLSCEKERKKTDMEAFLSSPVLDVRLLTALQVLQVLQA